MPKNQQHWTDIRDENINDRFAPKKISPLTDGQRKYIDSIEKSVITICIGPAGTGKGYIAVAKAIEYLKSGKIKKIVLTRPMVSCGEDMGYLPGSEKDKTYNWILPLINAMEDFMPKHELDRLIEEDIIQIRALSLLRGSSFRDSCVIMDEAQNAEYTQLLMMLTRLETGSRLIILGDHRQSDLEFESNESVPLVEIYNKLGGIKEISRIRLTVDDVVRSKLIKEILSRLD